MSAFDRVPRRYDVSHADLACAIAEYDCSAALEAAKARRSSARSTPVWVRCGILVATSLFGIA
jgi:hypothetical protein